MKIINLIIGFLNLAIGILILLHCIAYHGHLEEMICNVLHNTATKAGSVGCL